MRKTFALSMSLAFVIACGSTEERNSAPSKLDPYFVNNRPVTVAAGKKFVQPMPWAVGQYIVTGNITEGKKMSVNRFSIVGKAEGGYVVEVVSTTEKDEAVIQYLVKGIEKLMKSGNPDDVEYVWVKVRDPKSGEVHKLDGAMLAVYKSMSAATIRSVKQTSVFTDGGVITVPAGTFTGTNLVLMEGKVLAFKVTVKGYFHPAVPINGLVKSESDDGKTETVLISYGTRGAKAVIPLK